MSARRLMPPGPLPRACLTVGLLCQRGRSVMGLAGTARDASARPTPRKRRCWTTVEHAATTPDQPQPWAAGELGPFSTTSTGTKPDPGLRRPTDTELAMYSVMERTLFVLLQGTFVHW